MKDVAALVHQLKQLQNQLNTLQQTTVSGDALDQAATAVRHRLSLILQELQLAQVDQLQSSRLSEANPTAAAPSPMGEELCYQTLFAIAPDAYLVTDAQGIIQTANAAATSLLNAPHEALVGCSLESFIAPDGEANFFEDLRQRVGRLSLSPSAEAGVSHPPFSAQPMTLLADRELALQPRGQTPVTTSLSLAVEGHQRREGMRLFWLFRNITERKQTEQNLRQSEEAFRHFAENSQSVVWITDPNSLEELYVSPAYERIWGRPREDVLQHPHSWLEAIHPDDRQQVQNMMQAHYRGMADQREYRVVRPDGEIRWVRDQAFPIRNGAGEIYCFGGLAEDITEQKRLELSLQTSEAKLSNILDRAIASIVSLRVYANRDWEYEYYSNGCEALCGYTSAELMADKHLWTSRVLPEDLDSFLAHAYENIFAERDFTDEIRFRHRDGSIRWFASSHTSQKIADDCWLVTAVNHDITERKQTQEALQYQVSRDQLVSSMAQDIRQSLNLSTVLARTVNGVRTLLKADRVIIVRFHSDWQGEVIMESVSEHCSSILSSRISDPCFRESYLEAYRQGRIATIHNVDEASITPGLREMLGQLQVKASLVAPLTQGENLWGLLIAHQCQAPRQWQPSEVDLVKQLSTQVSIAIQQSELYEQLQQQLTEIETIYDTAPIGLAVVDTNLQIVKVNQYLADLNGFSVADHLGRNIFAMLPNLAPQLEPYFHQVFETGEPLLNIEVTGETAAQPGVGRTWLESWIPLKKADGQISGINVVVLEVTQRKQTNAKIREQAALLDISPDAILVTDLERRVLYWNKGAERLYGWSAAEASGQVIHHLLQADGAFIDEIMLSLFPQGTWQGELAKVTKAGKKVLVSARWTLVRDDAGQPHSILSVESDITEKKQLEAQFYQAQRLEALGTLTGGIAHDLNNVLTPILAMAQLLRLTQANLPAAAVEQLQLIEKSAKRGASMVKQILTLTRGSSEELTRVLVLPILQEVMAMVQKGCPSIISVHFEQQATHPPNLAVMADPTHLHQVVMNLCINARDAMPQGGRLTLAARLYHVDQAMANRHLDAKAGDYVMIAITDTGTGISPEVRDLIFDPFFTTKDQGKGTGLGLAMVLGIVKNYGGFLQVDSEPGRGTEVQVYLPALAPEPDQSSCTPPSREPDLNGHGELILIVEDDSTVQVSLQSLLEAHHYRTLTATDGIDGLARYQQNKSDIDLVILDITMPNMNGIELIHRLKQLNDAVKIVAISGLTSTRKSAQKAGANRFVAKPYSVTTLMAHLAELLASG